MWTRTNKRKENYQRHKKKKLIMKKKIRDIRTISESDNGDYYKPTRTGFAFRSNYIEYETNGDKDKTQSTK